MCGVVVADDGGVCVCVWGGGGVVVVVADDGGVCVCVCGWLMAVCVWRVVVADDGGVCVCVWWGGGG